MRVSLAIKGGGQTRLAHNRVFRAPNKPARTRSEQLDESKSMNQVTDETGSEIAKRAIHNFATHLSG
jgi:hypothetical protein